MSEWAGPRDQLKALGELIDRQVDLMDMGWSAEDARQIALDELNARRHLAAEVEPDQHDKDE